MKLCDHTSVGILVWREQEFLLIERARPPSGWAPPAGHIDDDQTPEAAARRELLEETGLKAGRLKLRWTGRKENWCRRENGTWHHWHIFETMARGEVTLNPEEVKGVRWITRTDLIHLARFTRRSLDQRGRGVELGTQLGLELVWLDLLRDSGVIW